MQVLELEPAMLATPAPVLQEEGTNTEQPVVAAQFVLLPPVSTTTPAVFLHVALVQTAGVNVALVHTACVNVALVQVALVHLLHRP